MSSRLKRLSQLVLVVLLLAGCDAPTEPTPTTVPPTPTPTPQQLLDRAVVVWNQTRSFHFALETAGRTVSLDALGALSFSRAEGDVVAPDRLSARALISTPLGSTEMGMIVIGDDQWLTNPLNGEWEQATGDLSVSVADLFDPEAGIGVALASIENLERGADETVEEVPTVRLRGTLPGSAFSTVDADLAAGEVVDVDLWIGAQDGRIRRILLTEPPDGETAATWTFTFSNFDAEINIEPPS
ncbi:MAG TPA: LppX_LprAFG lipoprotein [Ardenticatenaceae bacterium]|nr:LppX_LprAFG lipoprotein [Ardenticatenaceae bacterium]